MKKFLLLVSIILLFSLLAACTNSESLSTNDPDMVGTIVAATLTAIPSATPTTASLLPEPSVIPSPSFPLEDWVSFTYDKSWSFFQGFILYYPQSWLLTIETDTLGGGGAPPLMTLTLEKSGFVIQIRRFGGSVSSCLYPENPARDGYFSRFGEYTEIMKGDGIVWRRAMPVDYTRDGVFYVVCELNPDFENINGFTIIGLIELQGPIQDKIILSEFDEILAKIKILE